MRSFVYYMGPIPANNNRQPSCSFADSLLAAHSLFFFNAGSQNQCVGRFWKRSNLGLRRLVSGEVCVNSLCFVAN